MGGPKALPGAQKALMGDRWMFGKKSEFLILSKAGKPLLGKSSNLGLLPKSAF